MKDPKPTSVERGDLEQEVLAALDRGELTRAATFTIEGYGPELLAFLAGLTQDLDEAGDIFSMACEDLWRGLPGFQRRSSLRTWVYSVGRNALQRYVRSEHRRRRRAVPLEDLKEISAVAERVHSTTRLYLRTEVKDQLVELRKQLSKDDQILLILRVDRGMDWGDVARVLSDDPSSDDVALEREKARLRQRFQTVKEKLRALAVAAGIVKDQ